jgi:hypothetical protein
MRCTLVKIHNEKTNEFMDALMMSCSTCDGFEFQAVRIRGHQHLHLACRKCGMIYCTRRGGTCPGEEPGPPDPPGVWEEEFAPVLPVRPLEPGDTDPESN